MKIIYLALLTLITTNLYSQDKESKLLVEGNLHIDSFYKDKSSFLIFSEIAQFDSLDVPTLLKITKNWASIQFVNLKEVMVAETEDQIVLNYISDAYYTKQLGSKFPQNWYIRFVIQFKNGKMKCSYYDDGNVSVLPSKYDGGYPARKYHFSIGFGENPPVAKRSTKDGLLNLHQKIEDNFESLKNSISMPTSEKEW
jgi:hypothetical protein